MDFVPVNRPDPNLEQRLDSIIEDDADVVFQSFPPERTQDFMLIEARFLTSNIQAPSDLEQLFTQEFVEGSEHVEKEREERSVVERVTDNDIFYLVDDLEAYAEARQPMTVDGVGFQIFKDFYNMPEITAEKAFPLVESVVYHSDFGYDVLNEEEEITLAGAVQQYLQQQDLDGVDLDFVSQRVEEEVGDWQEFRDWLGNERLPVWQDRYEQWMHKLQELDNHPDYLVLGSGHSIDHENSLRTLMQENYPERTGERINIAERILNTSYDIADGF